MTMMTIVLYCLVCLLTVLITVQNHTYTGIDTSKRYPFSLSHQKIPSPFPLAKLYKISGFERHSAYRHTREHVGNRAYGVMKIMMKIIMVSSI